MTAADLVLIAAALGFGVVLLHPRLRRWRLWRATVTPLASIIGSGFLVAGPILAAAAGQLAWAAMLALCATAYLFGAAIRYNIARLDDSIADGRAPFAAGIERLSELALAIAYFVSVAYYLNLFAAFGLRLFGVVDPFWVRTAACAVIAVLGAIGSRGGLKALERVEVDAVGIKLAVIGGLFAALILASIAAIADGGLHWPKLEHPRGTHELAIILGLVILVQGFETSRYLGAEYDAATRIKTMKWAQWISTGIYLAFILLITRYFGETVRAGDGETAILDILKPLGIAVAPMIILAALASQSSAAIADMNGAGGLLSEATRGWLTVNMGNLTTAAFAIAITALADIYEIITYASKAFVIYYALQSLQALIFAMRRGDLVRSAVFSLSMLVAVAIVGLAVPAAA